jgi:hypothetical protein
MSLTTSDIHGYMKENQCCGSEMVMQNLMRMLNEDLGIGTKASLKVEDTIVEEAPASKKKSGKKK